MASILWRAQSNSAVTLRTKQIVRVWNISRCAFSSAPSFLPPRLTSPAVPEPEGGVDSLKVGSFVDRFSFQGHQRRILTAEAFFQSATRQASDPQWFGPGRIDRDFRHRHALLTMHLWFLHKRLISDEINKEKALMVQEEMFNVLWEDTTCRIRQQGVNELLVNKNLLQVQQYTFLHLTHYDHIYTDLLDKPAERLKELRNLVWSHILVRDEAAQDRTDHLDRIAWYIEANYQNILMHWPDEYYRQGLVAWVNLPDFSNMRDAKGNLMKAKEVHPDDVILEPWQKNITMKGIEYFWHPETFEVRWDRPVIEGN